MLAAVINDPDEYTNVRNMKSASGAIVAQVTEGEQFYTYPQKGNWWQIKKRDGQVGYMHSSRIKLVPGKLTHHPVERRPRPAHESVRSVWTADGLLFNAPCPSEKSLYKPRFAASAGNRRGVRVAGRILGSAFRCLRLCLSARVFPRLEGLGAGRIARR
jgi:hypothetical protein